MRRKSSARLANIGNIECFFVCIAAIEATVRATAVICRSNRSKIMLLPPGSIDRLIPHASWYWSCAGPQREPHPLQANGAGPKTGLAHQYP